MNEEKKCLPQYDQERDMKAVREKGRREYEEEGKGEKRPTYKGFLKGEGKRDCRKIQKEKGERIRNEAKRRGKNIPADEENLDRSARSARGKGKKKKQWRDALEGLPNPLQRWGSRCVRRRESPFPAERRPLCIGKKKDRSPGRKTLWGWKKRKEGRAFATPGKGLLSAGLKNRHGRSTFPRGEGGGGGGKGGGEGREEISVMRVRGDCLSFEKAPASDEGLGSCLSDGGGGM